MPPHWPGYALRYRFGGTTYDVDVRRDGEPEDGAGTRVTLDGAARACGTIPLVDDGRPHRVVVRIAGVVADAPGPS